MTTKLTTKLITIKPVLHLSILMSTLVHIELSHGEMDPQKPSLEEKYKNWFQVELIIFKRHFRENGESERWPAHLELNYPHPIQNLIRPELDALDEFNELEEHKDKDDPEEALQAFNLLDDTHKGLLDTARAINRQRHKKILVHYSWYQEMLPEESAPNIVLSGGNEFEGHFELEGSVRFSLNRYLHMRTNLWLSEFVPNYGQETDYWPNLPKRPVSEVNEESEQNDTALIGNLQPNDTSRSQKWAPDLFNSKNKQNLFDEQLNLELDIVDRDSSSNAAYLVKDIAFIEQNRRMRSKELHYIDHPKVGILTIITPLNIEKLTTPKQ